MDYGQGRPLAPRPLGPPPPHKAPQDEGKKRKRTAVACKPCRERKTACNSVRPVCAACEARQTECFYLTKDESETKLQALRRENKSLNDLFDHLRTLPEDVAQSVLLQLRSAENPLSVLKDLEDGSLPWTQPSQNKTVLAALPQVRTETELTLMRDHPNAYPALDLSRDAIMAKDTLLDSAKILAYYLPTESTSERMAASPAGEPSMNEDPEELFRLQEEPNMEVDGESPTAVDPLLETLKIKFWTTVNVTDTFAARAIALYLENDHPVLNLFDAELFLKDLTGLRQEFCSSFLVAALLAFACQSFTAKDPEAAAQSFKFEKEAELLWRADGKDSLLTTAGLMLLYMSHGAHGSQRELEFVQEASGMARRLKLFGVKERLDAEELNSLSYEAQLALSHTTWGVFNLYTLQAQYYLCTATQYHPKIPIPGEQRRSIDDHPERFSASERIIRGLDNRHVFHYYCKLWVIASKILLVIRDTEGSKTPPPLAFALSQYGALLELMDSVPETMTRQAGAECASVLEFHISFHTVVMDLFRPFVTSKEADYFRRIAQGHNSPEAIFAASVLQLKGIVIEYTSWHPSASHHIYWNTALIYMFNAIVKDRRDPHWRFYFWLCLHCYSKLYECFTAIEGVVQSLLVIAVNYGAISRKNAARAMQERFYKDGAGKRARSRRGESKEKQRSTYAIDLDLAVRDRDAADVNALIANFEDMDMFDEFTMMGESDSSEGGHDVHMAPPPEG